MSDSKPNCDFAVIVTNPSGSNWRDEYAEQRTAAEQAVLDAGTCTCASSLLVAAQLLTYLMQSK